MAEAAETTEERAWMACLKRDPAALADFRLHMMEQRQASLEKCALKDDADARAEVRAMNYLLAAIEQPERDEAQLAEYRDTARH